MAAHSRPASDLAEARAAPASHIAGRPIASDDTLAIDSRVAELHENVPCGLPLPGPA